MTKTVNSLKAPRAPLRFAEAESRMLVAGGWGRGTGVTVLWGQSFRWGSSNALEMDGGEGCTTV